MEFWCNKTVEIWMRHYIGAISESWARQCGRGRSAWRASLAGPCRLDTAVQRYRAHAQIYYIS